MRKTILAAVLAACWAGTLFADSWPVSASMAISPAAGGAVVTTLSGSIEYCTIGITGAPVATVVGNQVNIVTPYLGSECPGILPGGVYPPTLISLPVNLGALPDGHYDVTWTLVGPGRTIVAATSSFTIASGVLIVAAVPLFSPAVDAVLGVLLCVVAVVAMRR